MGCLGVGEGSCGGGRRKCTICAYKYMAWSCFMHMAHMQHLASCVEVIGHGIIVVLYQLDLLKNKMFMNCKKTLPCVQSVEIFWPFGVSVGLQAH